MAYASVNFRTKKALKDAVTSADPEREYVYVKAAGAFPPKQDGTEFVEGPWYPEPHKWYAQVSVRGGRIVGVK